MEPESPSPYPQVPATCPYPESIPSSPHDPLQLPEDPSYYYPPIYAERIREKKYVYKFSVGKLQGWLSL